MSKLSRHYQEWFQVSSYVQALKYGLGMSGGSQGSKTDFRFALPTRSSYPERNGTQHEGGDLGSPGCPRRKSDLARGLAGLVQKHVSETAAGLQGSEIEFRVVKGQVNLRRIHRIRHAGIDPYLNIELLASSHFTYLCDQFNGNGGHCRRSWLRKSSNSR